MLTYNPMNVGNVCRFRNTFKHDEERVSISYTKSDQVHHLSFLVSGNDPHELPCLLIEVFVAYV